MGDQFSVLPLLNQHADAAIGHGAAGIVGVMELEPDISFIRKSQRFTSSFQVEIDSPLTGPGIAGGAWGLSGGVTGSAAGVPGRGATGAGGT